MINGNKHGIYRHIVNFAKSTRNSCILPPLYHVNMKLYITEYQLNTLFVVE